MRRIALIVTLVSVGIWTLIAVVALLGGGFGDTQWKVLLSSMLVTAATVVAMACSVPLQSGRLGPLPWVGIIAAIAGFGLTLVGLWVEESWDGGFKTAISLILVAIAIASIGLIDGARVRAAHRWLVQLSQVLVAFAAALLIAAIWGEIDSGWFWRLTGVVLVLTAASAVTVPVLHRMAGIPEAGHTAEHSIGHCPLCGAGVQGTAGNRITCAECGQSFEVRV